MAYTVVRGDNLTRVAAANGVSLQELLAANPDITDPNKIQVGQVIQIPGEDAEASTEVATTDGPLDTTPEINETTEAAILEVFPSASYWLTIPDVRAVLEEATTEGWSPDRLIAAMEETDWWRNTQASARVFDERELRDPASVQAQLDQQRMTIQKQAMAAGIGIDANRLGQITRDSLRLGWTRDQTTDALFNAANDATITGIGSVADDAQAIRGIARAYHVPISDDDATMYALRVFNGTLDIGSVQTSLMQSAKAMFPHLAEQFDLGLTVEDYMRPLVNVAAGELDMNPNAIDLTGTKFSDLYGMSSYTDVRSWARQQDEWQYTDKANATADDLTLGLLKTMGVLA
jgi:murein DD-endopeptidase MepM/ murein hydrolase activator NlpD